MTRKKITADELLARAKANGYQRGAHRDKGSLRDQNKHVDKVKPSQGLVRSHVFPEWQHARLATISGRSRSEPPRPMSNLQKDNPCKLCRFAIMEVTKFVDAGGQVLGLGETVAG
jgi:hypothetical protein